MSVDALMDSDQMSREMIERVGPRVALQPCDDPKYRELAQEFLNFAEECQEPITVIRLTSPSTVEVDYAHVGHLESSTEISFYNAILSLHLAGEAEVPMVEFIDRVDWGNQSLSETEKLAIAYDTVTHLEAWVPHATFFADASTGSLHLGRDVVVVDSRFCDEQTVLTIVENDGEIEHATAHEVVSDEESVAVGGLKRGIERRRFEAEVLVDNKSVNLTKDELAILLYSIQFRPRTRFKRADVFKGGQWQKNGREDGSNNDAFARAASKLCDKLPEVFIKEGEKRGRNYYLLSIPDIQLPGNDPVVLNVYVEDSSQLEDVENEFDRRKNEATPLDSADKDEEDDIEIEPTSFSRTQRRHASIGREALAPEPLKKLPRFDGPALVELADDSADREALLEGYDSEGIIGRVSAFIFLNADLSEQDFAYLTSFHPEEVFDYLKELELPEKFFMAGNFMAQRFWLICEELGINELYKEKRRESILDNSEEIADQPETIFEQVVVSVQEPSTQPMTFITTSSITISATPVEPDPDWHDYANCLGVDPDLFFPERGASTREAKEVCHSCEVRHDCLEFSLQNGEKFGIWGGLSERERRRIRRQRAQAARSTITA